MADLPSGFTDKPWDGAASRFKDTNAYCQSCLIDENDSGDQDADDKVQAKCHLPVREPDGAVNVNALSAAAAALAGGRGGGVKASPASKAAAARKLRGLYARAKKPIPESLQRMG